MDLGSITDAAAAIERNKKSKQQLSDKHSEDFEEEHPSLILEHAGTHSRALSHVALQ